MSRLSAAELLSAIEAGSVFWNALAADDDQVIARLLPSEAIAALADEITTVPSDIAARVRRHLQVAPEVARQVGLVSRATILENGDLRLMYVPDGTVARPTREIETGWRFELVLSEGAWFVDPIRAHSLRGVEVVELPVSDA